MVSSHPFHRNKLAIIFQLQMPRVLNHKTVLSKAVVIIGKTSNDVARGATMGINGDAIPRAPSNYGDAKSLWGAPNGCAGRRKVPTMSQALSSTQYICFQKTSVSNMGAPNLLLAPGAIQPRYAPGCGQTNIGLSDEVYGQRILMGVTHKRKFFVFLLRCNRKT